MFSKNQECIYPEIYMNKVLEANYTTYFFQTLLRIEKNNNVYILKINFKYIIDNNVLFKPVTDDHDNTIHLLLKFNELVYRHQKFYIPQNKDLALNQNTEAQRLISKDKYLYEVLNNDLFDIDYINPYNSTKEK